MTPDRTDPACETFAQDLSLHAFGELADEQRPALESHLAACAGCRAERDLLVRSLELLRGEGAAATPILKLSDARRGELLTQARSAAGSTPRSWFTLGRVSAVAAVILGATITGDWLSRRMAKRDRARRDTGPVVAMLAREKSEGSWREVETCQSEGLGESKPDAATLSMDGIALNTFQNTSTGPLGIRYSALCADDLVTDSTGGTPLLGSPLSILGSLSGKVTVTGNPDATAGYTPGAPGYELPDVTIGTTGSERADMTFPNGAGRGVFNGPVDTAPPNPAPEPTVLTIQPGDPPLTQPNELSAKLRTIRRDAGGGGARGSAAPGSPKPDAGEARGEAEVLLEELLGSDGVLDPAEAEVVSRLALLKQVDTSELSTEEVTRYSAALATVEKQLDAVRRGEDAVPLSEAEIEVLSDLGYDGGSSAGGGTVASDQLRELGYIPIPGGSAGSSQSFGYDEGVPETAWKVVDPTQAHDAFDVSLEDWQALVDSVQPGGLNLASGLSHVARPGIPVDPASLGMVAKKVARALADGVAPSDVVALEPQLKVAFGFDPGQPMTADAGVRIDAAIREFMDRLAPRQGETPRDMFFRYFGDHPFVPTRVDRMSTFGMDVDTASYNLVRAYLTKGNLPPKAAVRSEEFVNAFRHGLAPPAPDSGAVFAIHADLAPSPFGEPQHHLLRVGLKAKEIDRAARRPVALTFVIDVSGSMEEGGRLELVKQSLRLLVDQLDERDTLGIVTFRTDAQRVLDPTNAANREKIFAALDALRPDGSTNADAGLRLGYDLALEQLRPAAENRVILCSDGVANTGVTDAKWLSQRIRDCKARYLFLNCIGVGMNNHNDALMEQLADEGDGFCAYVDRIEEAREIFVERLTGTLMTVARNAKIQVEFDPAQVRCFRQIGYENRALAHADFRNDRVDAGEVGAGHEVIALYELELFPEAAGSEAPLATVRCRYEIPHDAEIQELERVVSASESCAAIEGATPRFRLAAAVAEFAEILRQSVHARDGSLALLQRFAEPLVAELPDDPDVPEFVALVKQAARLPDLLPRRTELTRVVDQIKRTRCLEQEWRQREPRQDPRDSELLRQLEEQNRRLEQALRDALDRAARGS